MTLTTKHHPNPARLVLELALASAVASLALAVGCDDKPEMVPPPDAGVDEFPIVPASLGRAGSPSDQLADYSCLGTRTRPPGGASIDYTLHLQDFQSSMPSKELTVRIFPDNVIRDTCTAPECVEAMSDLSGDVPAMGASSSWFAYQVLPKMGDTTLTTVVGSAAYNELVPDAAGGEPVVGSSVSEQTLELIPIVLGFRRAPGTAILAGRVRDCMATPVRGVTARAFAPDGTEIAEGEGATDPHYRYFDGRSFPSADAPYTQEDGLFAAANFAIPSGEMPIRVEIWGRLETASAEPVLLACEQARLFADTVTILNMGPSRSDGPTCSM